MSLIQRGILQNPFTDKEVEEKFLSLAEPLIGTERCQSFLRLGLAPRGSQGHRKNVSDPGALAIIIRLNGEES